MVLLLAAFPQTALSAGEQYIEPYNVLAGMLNERAAAAGSEGVSLKNADSSVTQADLNNIRTRSVSLMRTCFTVPREFFDLAGREVTAAFPSGLKWDGEDQLLEPSLMSGIGRNGYFTKVPPEWTHSGQGAYDNDFTDVPLLWIHFEEIYSALSLFKYTREAYYVSWQNRGEPNQRDGDAMRETWEAAKSATDSSFVGNGAIVNDNFPPHSYAIGKLTPGLEFAALRRRSCAFARVDQIPTSGLHQVHFYNYATVGSLFGNTYQITDFDNTGVGAQVKLNQWTCWHTSNPTSAGSVTSEAMLGTESYPAWGPYSVDTWTYKGHGWKIDETVARNGQCVVIEWTGFSKPALENPIADDPEADGLAATGCEYTGNGHPPVADQAWRNMKADPLVKFPLGISSGIVSGRLRVKAYISEYTLCNRARQMFSLDTAVISDSIGPDWRLVTVKRPSGTEVIFSLSGQLSGQPLNTSNKYLMVPVVNGYEIHFPDGNNVVHVFGSDGNLCQVRMTRENHEAHIEGNPAGWPGLVLDRAGTHIQHVTSPLWVAHPIYNNELVDDVKYDDLEGNDIGNLLMGTGSRIFTWIDETGKARSRTRVSVTNGRAEVFYGVYTDGGLFISDHSSRSESYDENSGEITVTETHELYPNTASSSSNVLVRTLTHMPWGFQMTSERIPSTSGADKVTTYAYYTDSSDTNNYGRLHKVVQPDGSWVSYAYDSRGRRTQIIEPVKNAGSESGASQCKATRYYYGNDPLLAELSFPIDDIVTTNDHRPRLIVESVPGAEVSRTYSAYLRDRRITRQCTTAGASYDDIDSLVTTLFTITNGTFEGYTDRVEHPDGTLTLYTYSYDADASEIQTTRRTGAGSGSGITNGTEEITIVDDAGRTRSSVTRDILTGMTISGTEYARDAFGRPTCVSNILSGTFTVNDYGLFGLARTVDTDGIETQYEHTPSKSSQLATSTRLGVTTRYEYDVRGNVVVTWRSAAGQPHLSVRSAYDSSGRLSATTNELGYATTYSYSTNGNGESVTTITYPNGATRTETLYRDGRVRQVTGTAVSPVCFDYGVDSEGQYTIEYQGADDTAEQWEKRYLNMLGRTARIVYPDGYTVSYVYDTKGRQIRESDGFTTRLTEYNALSSPFRTALDMNNNGIIDNTGADRISETLNGYCEFNGQAVREMATRLYTENGSPFAPTNSRTLAALDGSSTWHIMYGRTNHTLVVRNRAAASRMETVTRPDGTQTVNHYTNGLLRSTIHKDSPGAAITSTVFEYDAWHRLSILKETAASGGTRTTRRHYNADGRVTNSTVTASGCSLTTTFEFDSMGRCTKEILPDGGAILYTCNDRGALIRQTGCRSYPVTCTYDEQGRLSTLSTYRNGTDAAPDTTRWSYDSRRGWLKAKQFADGTATAYDYFPNSLLRKRTWSRGLHTEYLYDRSGSITNVAYSDGTPGIRYQRDRLGRPVEIRDAVGIWTNRYLPDGQLSSATLPQLAGGAICYAYDRHGRLTNMAVQVSGSTVNRALYTFNSAGKIGTVSDETLMAAYQYGQDGETITSIDLNGLMTVTRSFDGHNRLLSIINADSTSTVSSAAFTYNRSSQRTRQLLADGSYWLYGYDELGQLTGARRYFSDGIPDGGAQFRYSYDTIGNRTASQRFRGLLSRTSVYTANSLNQYTQRTVPGEIWTAGTTAADATATVREGTNSAILTQRHGEHFWATLEVDNTTGPYSATNLQIRARKTHIDGPDTNDLIRSETRSALISGTPETFTYDTDGNLLSDGLHTYTWNAENRLITVESLSSIPDAARVKVENLYDYMGRRTTKRVSTWDAGHWTLKSEHCFAYHGWNPIIETQISSLTSHPSTNFYLWGLDLSGTLQNAGGIGGLLAVTECSVGSVSQFFPAHDGNGNISHYINATTASIAATYEYSPFGQLLKSDEATPQPFRFSTKYHDTETDLLYYGYRFYNPESGRWLSRDPIGENGGMNLYGFVGNSPIDAVDANGLALYAVGGTWEKATDKANPWQLYNETSERPRRYFRGPGFTFGLMDLSRMILGRDTTGIAKNVKKQICKDYCEARKRCRDLTVNLTGWSRGALICMGVAKKLNDEGCKCDGAEAVQRPVQVNWIGLFDAVERVYAPGRILPGDQGFPSTIPDNVENFAHAIKTKKDGVQRAFPTSIYGRNERAFSKYPSHGGGETTHNDIGNSKTLGNNASYVWIKGEAIKAGVSF